MSEPLASLLSAEPDVALEAAEETGAALAHDVGKYVTRIARNVQPGAEVPAALVPLVVKDLYETHRGARASSRFAELREALPPALRGAAELTEAAERLARIDALEARLRAAEDGAAVSAVGLAREVEALLARVLRAIREERAAREASGAACAPPARGARG